MADPRPDLAHQRISHRLQPGAAPHSARPALEATFQARPAFEAIGDARIEAGRTTLSPAGA